MRRKTVTHFRRFFTVLKYSPIGVKFPPIITLRTLYTVKKKKSKIFKSFLVMKVWMFLINFDAKRRFLNLFKIYIMNNFSVFYYRNLIRGYFVTNWQGKKVEKTTLKFFFYSAFSRFFQDFCHICYHNFISIWDNWTIPTAMSSWDMRLNHKILFENMFWNSAL
jgi:hypothetical protein